MGTVKVNRPGCQFLPHEMGHQFAVTAANTALDLGMGPRRKTQCIQGVVYAPAYCRVRVNQRAVQIENDCFNHGFLRVEENRMTKPPTANIGPIKALNTRNTDSHCCNTRVSP